MAKSTDPNDYQHVPRPVAAMPKDFASGDVIATHSHPRGQLVHAARGLMWVEVPGGTWAVPPRCALWIPAGVPHSLRMVGPVAMRTLYVDTRTVGDLPSDCRVIEVSALLHALILAAVDEPMEYDEDSRGGRIVGLILDELRAAKRAPVHLPMPHDRRLARLCAALMAAPDRKDTLDEWGEAVGGSGRTLARLFRTETGMSFAEWRQRARLVLALSRLAEGESVGSVARALGYRSPSAFTQMFRKTVNRVPGEYRA